MPSADCNSSKCPGCSERPGHWHVWLEWAMTNCRDCIRPEIRVFFTEIWSVPMSVGDVASDPRLADVVVKRILLVEDEADTAEFLKTLLEREHYSVLVAKDGGQAQSILVMRKPDFVILDLILPGESGFEICERFKKTDPAILVLILSGIEMDDAFQLAKRVGADAYLTKPFEPDTLLKGITETAQAV